MNQTTAYCKTCEKEVTYLTKDVLLEKPLKGIIYQFQGITAYCPHCGKELKVPEIDKYNASSLDETMRRESGIISRKRICNLPKRYDIGKRPLSLLLGWGELTFHRYYDGDIPSKNYSDILNKIYDNPEYYLELLEQNKGKLPSKIAYTKSKAATTALLNSNPGTDSKVELAMEYISHACGDISPFALHKAIYYAQGFYYAFFGSFLFDEDCEAWSCGPVYRSCYEQFSTYHFNPVNPQPAITSSVFTETEKTVLDSVIRYFCCYSDMILKTFIKNELFWLDRIKDLPVHSSAHLLIPKEELGAHFVSVKENYKMMSTTDIQKYTQDLFKKI